MQIREPDGRVTSLLDPLTVRDRLSADFDLRPVTDVDPPVVHRLDELTICDVPLDRRIDDIP